MEKIVISIPEPCHENWHNMQAVEQGRFCASCQKKVIDFTMLDDKEIYKIITKGNANMCGHFASNQIDKAYSPVVEKRSYWHRYFFGLLVPAFLWTKQSVAQKSGSQTIAANVYDNTLVMGKMAAGSYKKQFEITGTIVDSDSKQVIPNVSVECNAVNYSTVSDSLGVFAIKSKTSANNLTIIISAIGYETKKIDLTIPSNGFKILNDTIYLKQQVRQLDTVLIKTYPVAGRLSTVAGGMLFGVSITYTDLLKELPKRLVTAITDSLKVYPNPVQRGNTINVSLKLKEAGNHSIQILDITGKVLLQEPIYSTSTQWEEKLLCDNRWSAGTYIIRVLNDKNGLVRVRRFIVE